MLRLLVCASLIAATAHSAVISDIPVKVVYEKAPEFQSPSLRNLHEKPTLTLEELEKRQAGVKNLEEKTQLSQEQQAFAGKNLPKIVTPDDTNTPIEALLPINNVIEYEQNREQNIDDIYDKIQEIVLTGAKNIENQVQKSNSTELSKKEMLIKVNATLENFLESSRNVINKVTTKQANQNQNQNQNIFQTLFSNFQTASSNFFGSFANPPSTAQGDEQQPQPGGNPILSGIQQFFGQIGNNILGASPTPAPGAQGDEQPAAPPAQQGGPVQLVQSAVQNLQNNFNNLFQPSTAAPGAQSDETATQGGGGGNNPLQFLTNAGSQVVQTFQNAFNRPPATAASGSQADENASPPANNNPIAGFITNLQNLNPFQQPTAAPAVAAAQGDTPQGAGNNPLTQLQGAGQGIINTIQSNNPFAQSPAKPDASNPLQSITGAIPPNPISEGIAGLAPSGGNPLEQGQNIVNQIASQVSQAAPQQDQPQRPIQNALQQINPFRRRTTIATPVDKASEATTAKVEAPLSNEVTAAPEKESKPEEAPTTE